MEMPFVLNLGPAAFQALPGVAHTRRHLSDMRSTFSNREAVGEQLSSCDPLIYEYWEARSRGSSSVLSIGMTRILPGVVGQECHMTRGHFHTADRDGDEAYVVLQGSGLLVLQSRQGENMVMEMNVNNLCYIPAGWAHRTVNTADEDLLFLSVWPRMVGHDYDTVEQGGFSQLVLQGPSGPVLVENPSHVRHETVDRLRGSASR